MLPHLCIQLRWLCSSWFLWEFLGKRLKLPGERRSNGSGCEGEHHLAAYHESWGETLKSAFCSWDISRLQEKYRRNAWAEQHLCLMSKQKRYKTSKYCFWSLSVVLLLSATPPTYPIISCSSFFFPSSLHLSLNSAFVQEMAGTK